MSGAIVRKGDRKNELTCRLFGFEACLSRLFDRMATAGALEDSDELREIFRQRTVRAVNLHLILSILEDFLDGSFK